MKTIKELLSVGSMTTNKNVREIIYEEIYDSIFVVEVTRNQAAWVWLLAYVFSNLDEDITETLNI